MAGNLDKALLQMAGFEDEGDLYAKAGSNWFFDDVKDGNYIGRTGKNFQYLKDKENDAASWGFKNGDARLNALLYAWSKDNPDAQITPELIDRLKFLSSTADSMNVSGNIWHGTVGNDPNAKGLVKHLISNPEKANEILKEKGFNNYASAIQNYFDWAGQYMNDATKSNSIFRNFNTHSKDFADNVSIASRLLDDKLVSSINTPTPEEIARNNIEADQMKIAKDKAEHERQRRAGLRAGLSDIDDPNDNAWRTAIPDEWFK